MENLQIGTMVQYITAPVTDRDGTQWQAQTFPATVVGWVGDKLDLVVIESGHYPSPVIISRSSNVVPYEIGKTGWRPIPASGGAGTTFVAATNVIVEDLLRSEARALRGERDSLNAIIRDQAKAMDEYRKERSGGMAKIAALKDENAWRTKQVNDFAKQVNDLGLKVIGLESALDNEVAVSAMLRRENDGLRAENIGLVEAYKRIDAQVIRLRGETCRACSSEVATRDSEIKSLYVDKERHVKTVNTLAKQVHDLESANARLTKSNENWARQYQNVCADLSETNAKVRDLRLNNDSLLARIEYLDGDHKAVVDRLADRTINDRP